MALTVGTRVQVTLSGEVPPPVEPNTGNVSGFGSFGRDNATRNKVGKLTMFAKTFIILDNKFFIPMTSVIQIEILPPDQQQKASLGTFGGNPGNAFGNTTGNDPFRGNTGTNPFGNTTSQKEDQPFSIQFSHPKYM